MIGSRGPVARMGAGSSIANGDPGPAENGSKWNAGSMRDAAAAASWRAARGLSGTAPRLPRGGVGSGVDSGFGIGIDIDIGLGIGAGAGGCAAVGVGAGIGVGGIGFGIVASAVRNAATLCGRAAGIVSSAASIAFSRLGP